jgi:hypothetical protein
MQIVFGRIHIVIAHNKLLVAVEPLHDLEIPFAETKSPKCQTMSPFITHSFHVVAYITYHVRRKRRLVRQSATCRHWSWLSSSGGSAVSPYCRHVVTIGSGDSGDGSDVNGASR